jgi:16S rRNA (cytosine967-C5)-methyltransferase
VKNYPQDVRALAALVLAELFGRGHSLSALLPDFTAACPLRDRGLLQELCFGVMRFAPRLQLILSCLMDKPLKAKDGDIQALLLLGLYQLDFMRVPDHAALDATVEASKHLKKDWASKLVNAVLRRYLREKSLIEAKFAKNPNFLYAHPQWLLDKLRAAWPQHWQSLLEANNQHPPLSLRINRRLSNPQDYLLRLAEAGIEGRLGALSPDAVIVDQAVPVERLPGFAQGMCSVQDEAAQLAALLLAPEPGQRVLDACCAPGGKTCHLLETVEALDVLAVDIDAKRLVRVEDNLARLALNARCVAADLLDVASWWDGEPFERILLDVPCSATGVIRRHPDIKQLRRPSDIAPLVKLQLRLLSRLWECLKPGGRLLYATCSVLPEENSKQLAEFVRQTPDAQPVPMDYTWGLEQPFGRQLLPGQQGQDGFYYAVLHKLAP